MRDISSLATATEVPKRPSPGRQTCHLERESDIVRSTNGTHVPFPGSLQPRAEEGAGAAAVARASAQPSASPTARATVQRLGAPRARAGGSTSQHRLRPGAQRPPPSRRTAQLKIWYRAWCGSKKSLGAWSACKHGGAWKTVALAPDVDTSFACNTRHYSRLPAPRGVAGPPGTNSGEHDRDQSKMEMQNFITLSETAVNSTIDTRYCKKLDAVCHTSETSLLVQVTTQSAKVTKLEASLQIQLGKLDSHSKSYAQGPKVVQELYGRLATAGKQHQYLVSQLPGMAESAADSAPPRLCIKDVVEARATSFLSLTLTFFYLAAKTGRFLVVSKESSMTPQGGLGSCRTGAAGIRGGNASRYAYTRRCSVALPGYFQH
ncbi:unnamed protein product [Prorocentrum cordatum]|uniref:Uncharacterized protein n=1 Tax=Prorocentrum cordatum TaxID=2364126 RepID=A0ABN9S2D2_9DINO|nr:unnamed protein product [Polarella glacialis]